jgi:hypothetical protein
MRDFWNRYKRNRSAVFGLVVILLVILMAGNGRFALCL